MDEGTKKKVEERAYQLFLARGGVHGYAIDDWIKAEKEVMAKAKPFKPVKTNIPRKKVR